METFTDLILNGWTAIKIIASNPLLSIIALLSVFGLLTKRRA